MSEKDILPKAGAGQEGTDDLIDAYLEDTPGQCDGVLTFREFLKRSEDNVGHDSSTQ